MTASVRRTKEHQAEQYASQRELYLVKDLTTRLGIVTLVGVITTTLFQTHQRGIIGTVLSSVTLALGAAYPKKLHLMQNINEEEFDRQVQRRFITKFALTIIGSRIVGWPATLSAAIGGVASNFLLTGGVGVEAREKTAGIGSIILGTAITTGLLNGLFQAATLMNVQPLSLSEDRLIEVHQFIIGGMLANTLFYFITLDGMKGTASLIGRASVMIKKCLTHPN